MTDPAVRFPFPLAIGAAALLAGYLALGAIGIAHGVGSLDGHGVMAAASARLATGAITMSRPPGHPWNELAALPAFSWIVQGGRSPVTDTTYGLYQLAGGMIALALFALLLRDLKVTPARAVLALACLAFSPKFLIESSDGEEFLWGLAALLGILLLLRTTFARGRDWLRWACSVLLAALATGYRIEFGAVAFLVIFIAALQARLSWSRLFALGVLAIGLLAALWVPLFLHQGVHTPYGNPLAISTRLGVALYKILFHALGLAPFAVALLFFLPGGSPVPRWLAGLIALFFALFFLYPTKIEVALPGVALLILLGAMRARGWAWTLFVAACASTLLLRIDCFAGRAWTGPRLVPGAWTDFVDKPAAKGAQVTRAFAWAATHDSTKRLLITALWPWELEWQTRHGGWQGTSILLPMPEIEGSGYWVGSTLVVSRKSVDDPGLLRDQAAAGAEIVMDRAIYHELFQRYDFSAPVPESVEVDGVPCRIVDLGN
jgi:hypothetical protein